VIYAQKINELYISDCGLSDWIVEARYRRLKLNHSNTTLTQRSSSEHEDYGNSWKKETSDVDLIQGYDVDSLNGDVDAKSAKEPLLSKPVRRKEVDRGDDKHRDDIVVRTVSSEKEYFCPAILPIHSQDVFVEQSKLVISTVVASVTVYGALKDAAEDSDYNVVFEKLKIEWTYVGGLLLGLAALEASVFATDPGSSFKVDDFAQHAIATGSIATGLGIVCDLWFLLRYYRLELPVFITRAKDIYGSYLFFSLSARLPVLSMIISTTSLVFFLGRVAYNSLPGAVVAISLIFVLIMGLQFVVWGVNLLFRWIVSALAAIMQLAKRLVPSGTVMVNLGRIITAIKAAAAAFRSALDDRQEAPTEVPSHE